MKRRMVILLYLNSIIVRYEECEQLKFEYVITVKYHDSNEYEYFIWEHEVEDVVSAINFINSFQYKTLIRRLTIIKL